MTTVLTGLRPIFYTKDELAEFLFGCLHYLYQGQLTVDDIWKALPKMGITIQSSSNNSINVKYWGTKIEIKVSFILLRAPLPKDFSYYLRMRSLS
jgi:hypothetical protein